LHTTSQFPGPRSSTRRPYQTVGNPPPARSISRRASALLLFPPGGKQRACPPHVRCQAQNGYLSPSGRECGNSMVHSILIPPSALLPGSGIQGTQDTALDNQGCPCFLIWWIESACHTWTKPSSRRNRGLRARGRIWRIHRRGPLIPFRLTTPSGVSSGFALEPCSVRD